MAKRQSKSRSTSDEAALCEALTLAALECREKRHAWPRESNPAHAHLITFEPTAVNPAGLVRAATYTMTCTAGCGVIRRQDYVVRLNGRKVRDGKPRYKYPDEGYRFPAQAGRLIDREELESVLLTRIFAGVKW